MSLVDNLTIGIPIIELLSKESVIGIDCEGVDLGTKGEVTVIQISSSTKNIYLFDILVCPELVTKLKPILESQTILKVIHDVRADRANLLKDFNINLSPVFDTQIAYKFIKPQLKYRIGFNKLCQNFGVTQNPLKFTFHVNYRENPTFWKTRPLTKDMVQYAAADVIHLHNIYERMDKQIPQSQKAAFVKACEIAIIEKGTLRNIISIVINWSIICTEIWIVCLIILYDIVFSSTVPIEQRIQIYPVLILAAVGVSIHIRLLISTEIWDVLVNVIGIHEKFKKIVKTTDQAGHYMQLYFYSSFGLSVFIGTASIYYVSSEIHFMKIAKLMLQFLLGSPNVAYGTLFIGVTFVILVNTYFEFYILVVLLTIEEARLLLMLDNVKNYHSPLHLYRTSQLLINLYFETSKNFTSFLVTLGAMLMIVIGSCLVICFQLCGFASDVSGGLIFMAAILLGKIFYSHGEILTSTGNKYQHAWIQNLKRCRDAYQHKAIASSRQLKIPIGNIANLPNAAFVTLIQDVVLSNINDITLAYG